jgi:uncharacterized cupredoxin-like copper-binding protein
VKASAVGAAAVVALVALLTTVCGYAIAAGAGDGPQPRGPGIVTVRVTTHYSQFSKVLDDLHVYKGTVVRFVVVNDDPIHHELIVGPSAVHAEHEKGSEAFHPPVPGEVSVDPNATGETFYRFDSAGTVEYACHLPGHYAFGMHGEITVDPLPTKG